MTPPRLSIRNLAKRFGDRVVLDGLDLDVPAGQSLVIIGQSGTGKSVLLKSILGLLRPDSGSILMDGVETVGLEGRARDAMRARFGMLFQGGALFDSLPVWRNISFALTAGGQVDGARMRALAIENLARVGLQPDVADLRPAALSGGMQKRVALARAIAARPEILFFDEPTTGLDPIRAADINALIREQVQALGATALTITHDMISARAIADRVVLIEQGRIGWDGPVAMLDAADHPLVRDFVHASKGQVYNR